LGHEIGKCQQQKLRPIGLSVLSAFCGPVSSALPLGLFLFRGGRFEERQVV
jgi:hypothetical protein